MGKTDGVKNLKIGEATHRKLSVKAAELGVQKGVLAQTLIEAALASMSDEHIQAWLENVVTSHGNS
jgi:hypothetical protein